MWAISTSFKVYSVTPKPDRQIFVNIEKVNRKYQFLMARFSKVVHPTRHSEIYEFSDKIWRFSPIKDIKEMSPKLAKKAHFGDISYNVFNRMKSSFLMLETLYFTILSWMDNCIESKHQKLIVFVYFLNIYKNLSAKFRCYRV